MKIKMKNYKNILSGLLLTAAAATTGLGLTACQSDKDEIAPQKQEWTVSMDATIGGQTRALDITDTKVTPSFTTSERVAVYNVTKNAMMSKRSDGYYLAPQANGASATLSGTLTGSVSVGDKLRLIYFAAPTWNSFDQSDPKAVTLSYGNQIGSNLYQYDYALADVTVSSVSGSSFSVSSAATFETMQSFFKAKFIFCDNGGDEISGFTTTYASNDYAMTITSSENSLVSYYTVWDGTSDPALPLYNMAPVAWNPWRHGVVFDYDTYFALSFRGSSSTDALTFSVVVSDVGTFTSDAMPAPSGGFVNGQYYCPANSIKLKQQP